MANWKNMTKKQRQEEMAKRRAVVEQKKKGLASPVAQKPEGGEVAFDAQVFSHEQYIRDEGFRRQGRVEEICNQIHLLVQSLQRELK